MNWLWILMLAALGILAQVAIIFGWIPGSIWISIGLILISALLLGYNVRQKHFMHGLLTAAIWSAVGGLLIYLNWDSYVARNPEIQEKLSQVPEGMDVRKLSLIGAFTGLIINSVILGLLTLLAGKLLQEKPRPAEADVTVVEEPDKHEISG